VSEYKITTLTAEQRARMSEWAEHWIEIGHSIEPADWSAFEDAARRCYEFAGLRWHGNVVRVSSPFALALAAPMAAYLIERDDAVRDAVHDAVHDAVRGAVHDAVHGAVDGAVHGAVHGAVDDAVHGAVHGAVDGAVRGAVDGAVDDAVHGAVHGAVDGAVRGAVRDAARRRLADRLRATIRSRWFYRLGGQWWVAWNAYTSFFREVAGLELDGDLWARDRAYADAQSAAGWWWPHREFVMVSDRPSELHLEQVGDPGWGSHRLHCADGPAIRWRDGWALHYWHGVQVSADLIEGDGWSAKRILEERNQEYRRCAIERMGWDRFIAEAGLDRVGDLAPDPGNPGGDLALYDIPEQIFDEPVRVLLCLNGTTERDGSRRRYGLTVPASFTDPVAAAAWTYDWPVEAYRRLARRA
jgi:hypothetical protein